MLLYLHCIPLFDSHQFEDTHWNCFQFRAAINASSIIPAHECFDHRSVHIVMYIARFYNGPICLTLVGMIFQNGHFSWV